MRLYFDIALHQKQFEIFCDKSRFRVVVAGRRFGKCLDGDSRIQMADGTVKKIAAVKAGDMVMSLNEDTYALEPKMVQHMMSNGVKETITIKTSARKIRCTPNHPLLANNEWRDAGDIKPGDLIGVAKTITTKDDLLPIPVEYVGRYLQSSAGICLKRVSRDIYDQIRGSSDGFFDPIADGDVAWEEVISVEASERVETFDLTIEGHHNFIANGVITHNTILSKAEILSFAGENPGSNVWYVAPTYRMAKQIMWREMIKSIPKRWIRSSNSTTLDIELTNGSIIGLRGADKPDSLRGVEVNFLVMDEMQDIKPEAWDEALRPTLAKTRGRVLFVGTPKAYNYLYKLYMMGQREELKNFKIWKSWQLPTITSPFIPVSEIESAKADMDPRTFRQEFMACLLPGTKIMMANGSTKSVEDVSIDDVVIHVLDDGKRVTARVGSCGEVSPKLVTDVVLETGEIISASSNHRFKVYND